MTDNGIILLRVLNVESLLLVGFGDYYDDVSDGCLCDTGYTARCSARDITYPFWRLMERWVRWNEMQLPAMRMRRTKKPNSD